MNRCLHHLYAFLKQEDGPTAVEYACVATIVTLGTNSNNTYSYVGQKVGRTAAS
jgi:Flp pilus assembly pilin Flp